MRQDIICYYVVLCVFVSEKIENSEKRNFCGIFGKTEIRSRYRGSIYSSINTLAPYLIVQITVRDRRVHTKSLRKFALDVIIKSLSCARIAIRLTLMVQQILP